MKKGIILATLAVFMLCLVAPAQDNYARYYKMYNDAMAKKNQGKLDEAKTILLNIKKHLNQGGIPRDNDLNRQIALCTTITFNNQMTFEAKGGQPQTNVVKTNSSTFIVSCESSWCTVRKNGNSVVVSCADNNGIGVRSTLVIVTADGRTASFRVEQQGCELDFYLHPGTVSFSSERDTAVVSVVTNAPTWYVDSLPYWMNYETDDDLLLLSCSQNEDHQSRDATVYVVAAEEFFPIIVHQAESDTIISVDKMELTFSDSASAEHMTITTNVDNLQVTTSDTWIEATVKSNRLMVSVQQNDMIFGRHGWVRIVSGSKQCEVKVHQNAALLPPSNVDTIVVDENKDGNGQMPRELITVDSWPSHLKVMVKDDYGTIRSEYTPFHLPVDDSYYYLRLGFEPKSVLTNKKQEVLFKPGFRFAAFTWAPKAAIGMMSGFVGSESWGAYGHFQATTPFVTSFDDEESRIAGYNMTLGPVYCFKEFPYLGLYAGVGAGAYVGEPHIGLEYEAGVMGFYKYMMLTMGFHSSRVSSTVKKTSFNIGLGGYLKRYYEEGSGYCSSDSRRWLSLNYVFRPAENGKGLMVGDIGRGLVRPYIKVMYISTEGPDLKNKKDIEGGAGLVFTPLSGIIDLCAGAALKLNIDGAAEPGFQSFGAELGAIVNVWRFPITVLVHESDILGEHHLYLDFGIGFHLGRFSKADSTYL